MNIVHSWDLSNFEYDAKTLEIIKENLYNRGYTFYKTPPDNLKAIEHLLTLLLSKYSSGGTPWLYLTSNSGAFLTTCSQIIPVSFALTTAKGVWTVGLEDLYNLFLSKPTKDIYSDYVSSDMLHSIKIAGLLFITAITEQYSGLTKFSSRIVNILSYRLQKKLPTVFTSFYNGRTTNNTWQKISNLIASAIGESSATLITEGVEFINFQKAIETPKLKNIRLE